MAAATAAAAAASTATRPLLRRTTTPSSPFVSICLPSSRHSHSHSHSHSFVFPLSLISKPERRRRALLAVAEEKEKTLTEEVAEEVGPGEEGLSPEIKAGLRPCELYVCNLPRSCDISQLLDLFKPFGTVHSVEVSRDAETGISRGCGFVTMSSILEAKAAIAALDGSDFGGRELRVKFSVDMVSGRKNIEALNTAPKRDIVFESPHKVYVGNLAWSVRPEDLREHFSQFGTVVSTRVLYDRKGGKNRVYGFLSFSSAEELEAAKEATGTEFHGRTLLVREVANRE